MRAVVTRVKSASVEIDGKVTGRIGAGFLILLGIAPEDTVGDCKKLAEDSSRIFTNLSNCSCGIMSDSNGEYILLTATVKEPLSAEEEQTIKNWLSTESNLSRIEVYIYLP